MVLCKMCQAIPMDIFMDPSLMNWQRLFVHHPTFDSLLYASKEGCNICTLLFNTINPTRSRKDYPCEVILNQPDLEYLGSPENLASKDTERPCFNVIRYYDKESGHTETWLFYKLGLDGYGYRFDIEYSGKLWIKIPPQVSIDSLSFSR